MLYVRKNLYFSSKGYQSLLENLVKFEPNKAKWYKTCTYISPVNYICRCFITKWEIERGIGVQKEISHISHQYHFLDYRLYTMPKQLENNTLVKTIIQFVHWCIKSTKYTGNSFPWAKISIGDG